MKNIFKIIIAFALILSIITPFLTSFAEAATKTYSATVKADKLYVREKASTKSKKLGTLNKGKKVTVYVKNNNGWSTIKYKYKNKDRKAYVSAKYLKYPTTQAEYYEIAKVKGENLKKSTNTFIASLDAGDFETIADKSYEKLEKDMTRVSTENIKKVKNKKKREGLMKSYISPAQVQLDRVYYEREIFFALRDTESLINNLNFEQASIRFEDVAEYKWRGEAQRNTKKIDHLPAKTVSYLEEETNEVEKRFSFSYIEQMPEGENWLIEDNPSLLPALKFKSNRNELYNHGIYMKNKGSLASPNFHLTNGNYNRFTAFFALNEYWKTHKVGSSKQISTLTIYCKDRYSWKESKYYLQDGEAPIPIDIDISDKDIFGINITGEGMVGLVDAKFYRK
ncbi:SH3 domain-containing protein [Peribacillus sp. NPDC097206]|uniref:SH3 domain-containing protein n=1 Tax=unclassified Peribacillus TaxID=2675266 RepID=UPI00380B7ED4